jgi:hypothetical protein
MFGNIVDNQDCPTAMEREGKVVRRRREGQFSL